MNWHDTSRSSSCNYSPVSIHRDSQYILYLTRSTRGCSCFRMMFLPLCSFGQLAWFSYVYFSALCVVLQFLCMLSPSSRCFLMKYGSILKITSRNLKPCFCVQETRSNLDKGSQWSNTYNYSITLSACLRWANTLNACGILPLPPSDRQAARV